ncbi:hypothetical protein GBA52_014017 [Prunus armeniaca]|nr:hypothetical protein GBA52_014017 [Prunus armeniaca]
MDQWRDRGKEENKNKSRLYPQTTQSSQKQPEAGFLSLSKITTTYFAWVCIFVSGSVLNKTQNAASHITQLEACNCVSRKGVREFIKVKVGSRRLSYRMLFYSILFFTFLLRFVFVMTAVDTIDGERKCSTIGCLGKRLGPKILGRRLDSTVPEVIYQILEEPIGKDELQGRSDIPQSLDEFMAEIKEGKSDAKTFAVKLRDMVTLLEQRTRNAKIQEYLYRHVASSSIPKQLHCLALRLANEHASNAAARLQLPSAELVPALVDNSYFHFVLASDNVLAASVVATSLVRNSLRPHKVVLHIITDRKTYYPMQAWFSLHPYRLL